MTGHLRDIITALTAPVTDTESSQMRRSSAAGDRPFDFQAE